MANLEEDALAEAEALLLDSVFRSVSDGNISASLRLAQAEALEQAAPRIIERFKLTAIALKRDHNSLQPVNQLPLEILVVIFKSCLYNGDEGIGEDQYRRDATQLHRLCAVCSRWKNLGQGSPILWCHVSGLDPLQHIEKALRLSEPMPITVVFFRGYNNQLSKSKFTAVVNPHITRWGRASFLYDDLDKNPQAWESSELPKLRYFGGRELPHLQVVDLTATHLRWDPGQLPGLRVLDLTDDVNIYSTSQLLQLLMGTPRLERLSLVEVPMRVDSAFQLSVTLPHLISIKLHTIHPEIMQHLLSLIQLPQYDGNRMDRKGGHHLLTEEYSNISNKPPDNESGFDVLRFNLSEVNLSKGIFSLFVDVGHKPVVWLLQSVEVVLRRFVNQLTASQGIRVRIGMTGDHENSPMLRILDKLDRFPTVRAIQIIVTRYSTKEAALILIRQLTWPKVLADGVVWHFPHLEITLYDMQDPPFAELGEMCRERRGATLRSGSPKAIKELRVSPWGGSQPSQVEHKTEGELDKLQDALGEGQLFWGPELWKSRLDRQPPESTSSSLEG
ncbi:hypothetical protein FS837_011820 [Tulasnella sp. UAMH 9824]|nr:hypothetical protein FS837_011820 [Tulasnella sp. UAMH 9824]